MSIINIDRASENSFFGFHGDHANGMLKLFDFKMNEYGYQFYQTPEERQAPIQAIRSEIRERLDSGKQ